MDILLRILKSVGNEKRLKILENALMFRHHRKAKAVYYSLNPRRLLRFNRAILKLLKKRRLRDRY